MDIATFLILLLTIIIIKIGKTNYQEVMLIVQGINKNMGSISAIIIVTIVSISYLAIKTIKQGNKVLLGFNNIKPIIIDLTKPRHIVIFGKTGSGKTETAKKIAFSTKRRKLIIDWAGEYLHGKVAKPQELNLKLTPHEIIDAISSAFQLTIPQQAYLLEAVKNASTLTQIIKNIKRMKANSMEKEIKNALLRRLIPLEEIGLFTGKLNLSEIDTLDLSGLTYEAKKLIANIVLRMFYNSPEPRILIIEEAQNIIPARQLDKTPTTAELIINELRKKDVSVILIAQMPSQISLSFRNADYIILHQLQLTAKEAQTLGLNNDEVKRIAKLETGECLIIDRGEKTWTKVIISKKLIKKEYKQKKESIKVNKEELNFYEKLYPTIEEIIEEISITSKWRVEMTSRIKRIEEVLGRITQDLRELYDAWEAIRKARIATNPVSMGDFIKRTNEKLAQLSTAIAILRKRQLELSKHPYVSEGENKASYQININSIESELQQIQKKIASMEKNIKQNTRSLFILSEKLQQIQGNLAEFERWVKEVFHGIQ